MALEWVHANAYNCGNCKDNGSVLKELKETNKTILMLAERMRKAETRMKKMDCLC